jgi:hypothetical protein
MKGLLILITACVFLIGCTSDESAPKPIPKYQVKAIEKTRNVENVLQIEANQRKQQMEEQSR